MKIRVADYIAKFLVKNSITDAFTVVGGGAMHLNDAFGHCEGMHCTYNHHEQASAIAAEAYARINNRMALCCVTTGPGGTNALTGVLGAWLDSVPMLVISGQVRFDTTAVSTGLDLRAMGDQEYNIIESAKPMTKYAVMITDPKKVKYHLQKALYLAKTGRPGPVWLDIPLNIQGAYIEEKLLESFSTFEEPKEPTANQIDSIIDALKKAKRPVIYAGSAIRQSGSYDLFCKLIKRLNMPVVTCWNSIDVIDTKNPLYIGRGGIMGDRAGNFAVQNSDVLLCLGTRLSIRQVGYNYKTFASKAFVIDVDIDPAELKKPTLHIELPICANVKTVLEMLLQKTDDKNKFTDDFWHQKCSFWKQKYPVVTSQMINSNESKTNVYAFIHFLSAALNRQAITVVGNGSACVVGSAAYIIKKDSRFIINSGAASMGYDLPAAIGASIASGKKDVICISGDGSLQMNIQELQTIITNKLPIKIFVINNNGYHSIRQTQQKFFEKPFVGIGPQSNDLEFPCLEKIANAYGYKYFSCKSNSEISGFLAQTLSTPGALIAEVFVDENQQFEPKSSAKKMPDGTLVSPPLEDMSPFLSKQELDSNMLIY